ncbi:hypothetical protein O8C74_08440 [Aliarcobacter butzleri]|uniref:hypothetical protein n=1 Tax=Aliarcobacter butzleri TaxID=28197 RepID=UPI00263E50BB|nr:hypothetical protein [Aliarcobacter butzleri]MDN5087097.1 hypothetical protein [Aliarcobacter butzleri]
MKNLFALVFIISNLCADTSGTDNNAINKEISNLISQVAPKTKNFKWNCETVSKMSFPIGMEQGQSIVDKCLVDTDIGNNFKVTCEYAILPGTNGATKCHLGW